MDFVGALPKTVKGFDSIWVIVDRLKKSSHFVPIKTGMSVAKLAETYIEQIVRLHGIPSIRTKGVSQNHLLSFDDNKVLKLSIGYAKHLFKCIGS